MRQPKFSRTENGQRVEKGSASERILPSRLAKNYAEYVRLREAVRIAEALHNPPGDSLTDLNESN
jgi:hypothetical protein